MSGRFPDDVIEAAKIAHKKYFPKGPYASVTLAQWAVESAYGREMPPGSNNPFGIKAVVGQPYVETLTREVIHGVSEKIEQKFAKYASIADAFEAHAKLLATSPIYAEAQAANTVESYVRAMAKHYATAPNYAAIILNIIRSFDLTLYDSLPDIALPTGNYDSLGQTTGEPPVFTFTSLFSLLSSVPTIINVVETGAQDINALLQTPQVKELEQIIANAFTHVVTPGAAAVLEPKVDNPSGAVGG